MFSSSWYQENLTLIKYWLLVINIFFMIIAIKAVVNHQMIVSSIEQVKYETAKTEEHTHYVNNFLTPYLKSEFAPYFFAHENNQIFPWEKIIKITTIDAAQAINSGSISNSGIVVESTWRSHNPSQRNLYLSKLVHSISLWHKNLPFFK